MLTFCKQYLISSFFKITQIVHFSHAECNKSNRKITEIIDFTYLFLACYIWCELFIASVDNSRSSELLQFSYCKYIYNLIYTLFKKKMRSVTTPVFQYATLHIG